MNSGIRSSLQTDEETYSRTPNADCTKGKGGANHIPSRGQGSYQRSFNDRKGRQAIASVLYFIVERPDEESPDELMAEPEELPEPWTLFTKSLDLRCK
ncbi:hypothetical protein Tco_0179465 [Tanacetum coccineum]